MKQKAILLSCSLLAFLPSVPYLFQAWRNSRLDSWDWIFYVLALPAVIWAWRNEDCGKKDFKALFVALPMLFLALGRHFHEIHALSVIGAGGFVWSMAYLAGGWTFAYKLLPGFCILALGTPSSSYRLAQLLTTTYIWVMVIKVFLAGLCFAWIYISKRFPREVSVETVLFLGAFAASCMVLVHANELYFTGRSFIPVFDTRIGEFYGRSIVPDGNTKRFFATSTVHQYRYFGDGQEISVLAVRCGKDVHEIHPASHCLRTSGWTVTQEQMFFLKDDLAVTEIEAHRGQGRTLTWVWYSNDTFSTSGFLGFRRRFRPDGTYHTFQVSTPIWQTTEKSRDVLMAFFAALPVEK